MIAFAKIWLELKFGRRALTTVEHALIAGVIVGTIALGFSLLANNASTKFGNVGTHL
jgi:Flp pilus assembly pilin Flp